MSIQTDAAADLFNALTGLLRSARAAGQRSRDLAASGTALGVLKTLRHGDVRPGDLAATLRVDPSVISRAVGPLEQELLVERKVDPVDGRASLLGLTTLGRERLDELHHAHVEQLRQTLGSWTDEEIAQASTVLNRLELAISTYQPPPSPSGLPQPHSRLPQPHSRLPQSHSRLPLTHARSTTSEEVPA